VEASRSREASTRYVSVVDPERARELVAAERSRIEDALAHLTKEPNIEEDGETDPADAGSELYLDEFDQGRVEDLQEQLAAVERAEQRLADGTYGLSVESGDQIPDERLEARPTAELTAEEERARG
jgi:DnaK suppressor protein